jgi:hypothetical protein
MPGKGMSFILYVVVLAVSITSVMMGLDWLSTPPPPVPKSVQTVKAPAKPATPPAAKDAKEIASAKTESVKSEPKQTAATTGAASPTTIAKVDAVEQRDIATAAPEPAGNAPVSAVDNPQTNASEGAPNIITNESGVNGTAAQANVPPPRCDLQACVARYRSFDVSDCTYLPFDGPRRLCTVGNPPRQASDTPAGVQTSDASKPTASPSCNYDACGAAYRSFDPATCTYQPFEGSRQLCTK